MRKTLLVAVVWLAVLGPGLAKADPILTPLVAAAALAGELSIPVIGGSITLASIASYVLVSGAVASPTNLRMMK